MSPVLSDHLTLVNLILNKAVMADQLTVWSSHFMGSVQQTCQ
jgi:hypothetical protein